MSETFAIEYIRHRLKEIGYEGEYLVKFRHLRLQPKEKRTLEATNELLILVNNPGQVMVQSPAGIFDYEEEKLEEMQYEHRGRVKVENRLGVVNDLQFIQVIFKNRRKRCH